MLEISSIMKFPDPLTSDPDLLQFLPYVSKLLRI